jgi:predicted acylesterase/phospholipase RssA
MLYQFFFSLFLIFALSFTSASEGKPFKKILVISGGGLAPGVGLGTIAGAKAAGFHPDLVITTCGSAIAASLYAGHGTLKGALEQARSPEYHHMIKSLLKVDTRYAPSLANKIEDAVLRPGFLPDLFSNNVMHLPEVLPHRLPNENFRVQKGIPRFVILAAKANFGPKDVGMQMPRTPMFTQVFFTDQDTAKYLRGRRSDIQKMFPGSYVDKKTEVITDASLTQAYRASISDPYFINPARIGEDYYFTGAIDLFPIQLAKDLGAEVMVTLPNTNYGKYDVSAILTSFGFNQQQVAIRASEEKDVIWAPYGESRRFGPKLIGPLVRNSFPMSAAGYAQIVNEQYAAAYHAAYNSVMNRSN